MEHVYVRGRADGVQEIVLSQDQDPFFKKNMYLNFGDLGGNIKDYVDQYQTKTKSNMNIESIADMKRFVEEYPEFRRLSGNVSKHVTLVGELSRRVDKDNLLEVSELEQSLACNENHAADLKVRFGSPPRPELVGFLALTGFRHYNVCSSRPSRPTTRSASWLCIACATPATPRTPSQSSSTSSASAAFPNAVST